MCIKVLRIIIASYLSRDRGDGFVAMTTAWQWLYVASPWQRGNDRFTPNYVMCSSRSDIRFTTNLRQKHESLFSARLQNCEKLLSASSCPSVRPHRTTQLPVDEFDDIWYLRIYWKSVDRIQVSLTRHCKVRVSFLYYTYSPTRYTMWSQWVSFN